MLEKSVRNSFIIVFLLVFACKFYKPDLEHDARIDCVKNTILLKNTNREEVLEAAKQSAIKKKTEGTSEGYTVLRMPDGRSTAIYGVPPEHFTRDCFVTTIYNPKDVRLREFQY